MMIRAVTRSTLRSTAAGDAVNLLTADRKQVKSLFQKYSTLIDSNAHGAERQPLAEQICMRLTVHAAIEETIFCPAAREVGVDSDLLGEDEDEAEAEAEAEAEHASAKDPIARIWAMSAQDDLHDAKVAVSGEYTDHHVKAEQNELFPGCARSLTDLKAIRKELAARKQELTAEMSEGMASVQ